MGEDKPSHSTGPRIAASVRWLAVAAWACFVWSRSLCDGPESSAQSNVVAELLRPAFAALGVHGVLGAHPSSCAKAAHFLEHLVLGDLVLRTHKRGGHGSLVAPRPPWRARPVCGSRPFSRLAPGRSGQIGDIALDCCGVACGMALVVAIRGTRSARPRCRTMRMCAAHCGKRSCRRTCKNLATMVSSVTAMRRSSTRQIHIVAAPPSRHVSRMAS